MFADEGEFRVLMVERYGWRPGFRSVTRLALIPYTAVVAINMTSNALRAEPLICLVRVSSQYLFYVSIPDILGRVALFALQRLMRPCEHKSSLAVIKTPFVKPRDLRIAAEMLNVTIHTGARPVLKMKTVSARDFIADFDVAGKTLFHRDLLAPTMAFRAVGYSLETCVCL